MRVLSVGHAVFAATMIGLGILGLITGDFASPWQPVSKALAARGVLVILCALVPIASGVGLLWRRAAASASRLLFAYLFVWFLSFKARLMILAPTVEASYQSAGETAVILAAAWALYACFAADVDRRRLGLAVGHKGVRGARVLFGFSLIAFGLSHFIYLDMTAPLVPRWLAAPVFWAYFTGCCYLLAGIAMLVGRCARLAAALAAVEMGALTLFVWLPFLIAGRIGAEQWGELVLSWTLTASAWVVADSYRGTPWLAPASRLARA